VLKTLKLALEGYEYQVEPLVQRLLTKLSTPEEATAAVVELLTQYLAVEDNYAGKPLDETMVALVKANKVRAGRTSDSQSQVSAIDASCPVLI
jgi:hypothetical protein